MLSEPRTPNPALAAAEINGSFGLARNGQTQVDWAL